MKKITKSLYLWGGVGVLALLISSTTANAQNTFPNNGNVGIGTSQPSARLDVNGNMIVDSSLIVKDSVRFQNKLTVDQDAKFKGESVFVGDAKAKSDLKIIGTTKMKGDAFVDGDFKFKGLADPSLNEDRYVTINKNGKVKSELKIDFIADIYEFTPCVPFTDSVGGTTLFPAPVWNHKGGSSYGVLYTADPCPGRVGIGTSNPNDDLHVVGGGFFNDNIGIGNTSIASSTDAFLNIQQTAPNGKDFVRLHNSGGDVEFKIDASGHITARDVKVTLNNIPDYVFKDDYNLLSIDEVERYIEKEGHLPNVKSEEEMLEDAPTIGEMNMKLLEKVEELTLYIIDLNKRIEALENENQQLQGINAKN